MTPNFTPSVISRTIAEHKASTMKLSNVSLLVLMCVVIEIKSEKTRSVCQGCHYGEYVRIKRAKYYSYPPLRSYNRSPTTYPIKAPVSYTPPPGYYLVDDSRQPYSYRPKVSKPIHEELGAEDINNVMRFLSQQDLDSIVEFGHDKQRESSFESSNEILNKREKHESKDMFHDNASILNGGNAFHYHEPSMSAQQGLRSNSVEYSNPNINELKLNTQLDTDRVMQDQKKSHFNPYEYQKANENSNGANIFTDSSLMQEEQLPKPSNLREDDYEASFTNNVPTIVKANPNSYKIENFGALPLMNYHSKLEPVDSYKVPHYTVTSPEKHRAPASMTNVPVEPAPPVSAAQEQSDAHLKATKIWTHKSKGTAYTLHDDGTLSLKRPTRNNYDYSYLIHS